MDKHLTSDYFGTVLENRLQRREMLQSVGAGAALLMVGCTPEAKPEFAGTLGFQPIDPVKPTDKELGDQLVVPEETHQSHVVVRWGDPLFADAPEFDPKNQTFESQSQQFGYNCDFVGFIPLSKRKEQSTHGLLVVNHEYTIPGLMFPDFKESKTAQQIEVELAAHGLSVVEIQRDNNGRWIINRRSKYNRRITVKTPMQITGPAASHRFLQTDSQDSELAKRKGAWARGTLNNCSGGKTPWGTVLSGEENFQDYFGNLSKLPDAKLKARHKRYGIGEAESKYQWEVSQGEVQGIKRFDVSQSPYEPFRFGWVVEVNPFDPKSTPKKRTALGRIRHEAATIHITKDKSVVVYSGDDDRFECVYKFVAKEKYQADPNKQRENFDLLDAGTLYVAKFHSDGTGQWLPLVHGEGPLTKKHGFESQGDVLVHTRSAADRVGATKMDRPEDIEVNPVNNKVYIALTNNTQRSLEGKPGVNYPNPRPENRFGHVIELTEDNDDHTGKSFKWEILLLCGNPAEEVPYNPTTQTWFCGYPKKKVSPISCPDNLLFDLDGNLWIATDGAPSTIKFNDGLFAVPVDPAKERGHIQQFLSAPRGSEVCGPELTPDNSTLFVSIQHPGDGEDVESHWPDGGDSLPRPSVAAIQSKDFHKRLTHS